MNIAHHTELNSEVSLHHLLQLTTVYEYKNREITNVNCYEEPDEGRGYFGSKDKTNGGRPCVPWNTPGLPGDYNPYLSDRDSIFDCACLL